MSTYTRIDAAGALQHLGYRPGLDFDASARDGAIYVLWHREDSPTDEQVAAVSAADAARAFIAPVTRRQMLTALHRAGLLTTIKAAVAASGDPELQIAFDESQEFQRNNPFLATMAAALGKTPAEVDAIFALARTL
ncbi:MAG: hypothetical protein RJA36_3962 [Pseudomonadota bacterium]|jgi:hypothetical protein